MFCRFMFSRNIEMNCSRDWSSWSLHEDPNTVLDTLTLIYLLVVSKNICNESCRIKVNFLRRVVFIGIFRHEDHQIVKWAS